MSLILGRKQRGGNIGLGTWDCGENGESEDDRFVTVYSLGAGLQMPQSQATWSL